MTSEEQVRELAYRLWEQEGRPAGRDQEHYFEAARILAEEEMGLEGAGKPSAPQPAKAAPRTGRAAARRSAPPEVRVPRAATPRPRKETE